MRLQINKKLLVITIGLLIIVVIGIRFFGQEKVDFNTEVKPLLNKKCISCHGGVKKEGGFSVLFRNEAMDTTDSGHPAIVPGHPDKSEMIRRLVSRDPEERMPYNHEPLSDREIDMLKRWIKEGAEWGDHWAYVAVQPTPVPGKKKLFSGGKDWVKSDIDYFILEKIKQEKLSPSAEAGKATLLRRVSLDLIGMPAPEDIAQKYLADNSADAYAKLVDTLLDLPQYGERWTAMWMDLARYADSRGYEKDGYRSIWRYRDWLIQAFNQDKPYDVFLTEQLAGDLLPDADDRLFLATAFNRNTMTNDEGGTDNEEFRTAAVIDRVNTTWETILGTTFACVQCHSHPYDPFKFEEYYKFMAFFNNTRDEDSPGDYPLLRELNTEDSIKLLALENWLQTHAPHRLQDINTFIKTWQPAINSLRCDQFVNSELTDTKWLAFRNNATSRLAGVNLNGKSELIYRVNAYTDKGIWTIRLDSANGPAIAIIPVNKTKGWEILSQQLKPIGGVRDLYFTYYNPTVDASSQNNLAIFDWFYFTEQFPGNTVNGYDSARADFFHLVRTNPRAVTPVMMENPDDMFRPTYIFERGNWMAKTAKVQADVPQSLNPLPEGAPRNRLGLAMWLTDKKNPLTARTLVNRIWEQVMGQGIAETLEDMGTQGLPPTHKNLLDFLSWQFMNEYKWSVKSLLREIVMSATYRQDSRVTEETLEKDPFNKYYARGARVRLSAEQVRDQALAVSGLLSHKMYGKSVMPYQPDKIWLSPYDGAKWIKSEGEDQYRRAIYTYWKRTSPYPSMLSFDGVAREVCQARRIRTNTPLQALTTLNDAAFVEMARHFAERMRQSAGDDVRRQISWGYEAALHHPIDKEKLDALEELYRTALAAYKQNPQAAAELLEEENGETGKAAMVLVANAMLNLDDLITKN
ncbi:MAG: DUF1553 domain-containing protein [Chitinophagaceae bacterium]|nr:DUF1553 domain-containing protein [Chitinophagaceae bacterium]MCW5928159.1 DUF1553 domain-containing protein [Chitinophagaceae bacterium]